jgi:hypothetical protein
MTKQSIGGGGSQGCEGSNRTKHSGCLISQIGLGRQQDTAHTGITGTGITCSQQFVLYRANRLRNFDILYILFNNNIYFIMIFITLLF